MENSDFSVPQSVVALILTFFAVGIIVAKLCEQTENLHGIHKKSQ
ncbi:hypothetical protein [Edaphobacter flagellatus]|nr:hypothetical protein [Edaphobacter flagellatus]